MVIGMLTHYLYLFFIVLSGRPLKEARSAILELTSSALSTLVSVTAHVTMILIRGDTISTVETTRKDNSGRIVLGII